MATNSEPLPDDPLEALWAANAPRDADGLRRTRLREAWFEKFAYPLISELARSKRSVTEQNLEVIARVVLDLVATRKDLWSVQAWHPDIQGTVGDVITRRLVAEFKAAVEKAHAIP